MVKTAYIDGSCPGSDPVDAEIGDTVTYCYEVKNTGDVTLTGVTLSDDRYGIITLDKTTLSPGESAYGTATHTITESDYPSLKNTATATGTPPTGTPITDTDDCTVNIQVSPGIEVVKTAYIDGSCPGSDPITAEIGDTVTYCYEVKNTGDVTLTGVTLSDDRYGSITLDKTTLSPGESAYGTATHTITESDYPSLVNNATATGTPPTGTPITDTDDCKVNIQVSPGIEVVKKASLDGSCPGSDPITAEIGDTVTYCYEVKNTGDVTLTGVTLSDDRYGSITLDKTTLSPGESAYGTATHTITESDYPSLVNNATATGTPPTGSPITDTDDCKVNIQVSPGIEVVKTAYIDGSCPGSDPVDAEIGDTVTYCYEVKNTGDVTLTAVTLSDDKYGIITLDKTTLSPGESAYGTATHTITESDYPSLVNNATATGTPPTGSPITDTDDCKVNIQVSPGIEVVKTAYIDGSCPGSDPVDAKIGDTVTYCYEVKNTGDVTLTAVTLSDDRYGIITLDKTTLKPGESAYGTATRKITESDYPSLVNTATAKGTPPTGSPITDTDDCKVNVEASHILVDKVTDPAGSTDTFEFTGSWSGGTTFSLKDSNTPYDSGYLAPGEYTVTETVPDGWVLTGVSCSGGTKSTCEQITNGIKLNLAPGETVTLTFTNTLQTGGQGKLDVSGYKFDDQNANRAWDTGEPGIEGWTIYLSDGTTTISTITGSDGSYTFTNLPAGTYTITEEERDGWTRTFPAAPGSYEIVFDGEEDKSVSDLNFGNAQVLQPQARLAIDVSPHDPCSNTPVVVTVSCQNVQGDLCGSIASMTLYYESSSVEMTKGPNGKWTATIAGQPAGTTLSVYAVPKDSQGNFIADIGTTATEKITWINCAIDIEKTADTTEVNPGDTITYTLTVRNTGSSTINDVTVVDTLPPGTLYVSANPAPSGVSGSVITWNLGALDPGASVVITLTATVESDVCERQSFTPSDEQNQKRGAAPPATGEDRLTIMAASPVDQELVDSLYRNMTRLEAKLNYVRKYRDSFDKTNATLIVSNVTLNGSVYTLMNYTSTTTGDVLTEAYNSSGALAWSLLVRPQKYDSLRTEYVNGRVVSENYITREPWEGLLVEYDKPYPGYTNLTVTYYPTGDTLVVVRDQYGNVVSKEYKKLPGVPPVPLELENCATVTGRIGEIEVSDSSCVTVKVICPLPLQGKLTLAKRPSVEVASVGQTITYTYTITNGGETTVSNIYVDDDMLGWINTDPITLKRGETTEITATYVVKPTDASPIKNVAIAIGQDPNGDVASDPAEAEVVIAGKVLFNKTAEPKVVKPGDTITYTIRYQNLEGGRLYDVYIVDHYPNEIYFISATPAPTSGNNVWHIGDLDPGASGEIVIVVGVAQELGNMSFSMDQSVSGSGYVNVYNNLCTTPPRIVNRAEMSYRLTENGESTRASAAAEVQLGPPATCARIKEHGSGSYETEDFVRYERGNRTITWNKSLSATHYPTSFSLPRDRNVNYTTLWVEKQKAKNYATDASFSEEYTYARSIKRESSLQMDENGSRLMVDTEFTGMGHVGILKARESNRTKNAMYWGGAVYESREDYVGSFSLYQKIDEYGEHLRSESEVSGRGFAAVDKRLGSAQRSYESGAGSYESSHLMDTLSSYMHKDISLNHAPANYTYSRGMAVNYTGRWYEGMWSKTDRSLISESFSALNRLEKETYARGLNEMETEAEFSGKADFRVLYQDLSGREGRTIDLVDQYIGDYRVNRKVSMTGVSRYSYPHISVRKEASVDLANSTYADYRIIVENDGNVNLGPVYILDIFPPGTEYVGSSARPSELTSEYANWTLLHLGIGDTATISLTLNITEEVSNLVNRVIVSGVHDGEWVTARNFSSTRIDWLECCPSEIIATKTAMVHNDTVSYRISLRNRANYTMVAFVIDYIPSDMQLINYSLTPSQIRENRIEWAVLDLRPGKRIDIDYNMKALRSGTFTNRARVEAYPIDGPGAVVADLAARAYVGVEIKEPEREGWTVPKCMSLNCTESYRDDWMSCSTCARE